MTCPVEGCGQPAGTRCTMSGCPGTSLRSRSLSGDAQKGCGVSSLAPQPTTVSIPSHEAAHNAVTQ